MNYTLSDVVLFHLQTHHETLFVAEKTQLPINIARFFIVKSKNKEQRGYHAHRQQSQYLICTHGVCEVICDDGKSKKSFLLDSPSKGLLVPPGIWGEQNYLENDTTLLVACDAEFDEADYIRDYDAFLTFRSEIQ